MNMNTNEQQMYLYRYSPTMGMGREWLHADSTAISDGHLPAGTSCCGINI
jgi:hypothetical protein